MAPRGKGNAAQGATRFVLISRLFPISALLLPDVSRLPLPHLSRPAGRSLQSVVGTIPPCRRPTAGSDRTSRSRSRSPSAVALPDGWPGPPATTRVRRVRRAAGSSSIPPDSADVAHYAEDHDQPQHDVAVECAHQVCGL